LDQDVAPCVCDFIDGASGAVVLPCVELSIAELVLHRLYHGDMININMRREFRVIVSK
jgi:hypothetical protein